MSLPNKMEVLGEVSERARQIEGQAPAEYAFVEALLRLNHERAATLDRRPALVVLLAAGLNWLLEGDRRRQRPAPRPHAPSCAYPTADCWCGAFPAVVAGWR